MIAASPPQVVVLAGPNGAGKSTAAARLIPSGVTFVNADEIAKTLTGDSSSQINLRAGRMMLERLDELATLQVDFALETTLSNRALAGRIEKWKEAGYRFTLFFLSLPNADMAVERVKSRVASGGHDVPEETIRRRYILGLKNFFSIYSPLADIWALYENSHLGGYNIIAEKPMNEERRVVNQGLWEAALTIARESTDDAQS